MEVFAAVAEKGSFAQAARSLRLSPPAVTRAIAALEDRLGARLLQRTTRSVRLTEAGIRFLADAQRILHDIEEAEDTAAGAHAVPRGVLHVTAPVLFGRMYVAPVLRDFLDVHPTVTADTLFVDRIVNIAEEGLDVAIRIGALPNSSLTAIRVGSVRRVVFGAPSYFAGHGTPLHPGELAGHRLVSSDNGAPVVEWRFVEGGAAIGVRVRPLMFVDTVRHGDRRGPCRLGDCADPVVPDRARRRGRPPADRPRAFRARAAAHPYRASGRPAGFGETA